MDGIVLWDFDGTLAHRPGMWRSAIIEAFDEHLPGHSINEEDVRPLMNHVPELESIVSGVGLGGLIETVFTSALTGYEKPHPEAFAIAKREAWEPDAHLDGRR